MTPVETLRAASAQLKAAKDSGEPVTLDAEQLHHLAHWLDNTARRAANLGEWTMHPAPLALAQLVVDKAQQEAS